MIENILSFLLTKSKGFRTWYKLKMIKVYSEFLYDLEAYDIDREDIKQKYLKRLDRVTNMKIFDQPTTEEKHETD